MKLSDYDLMRLFLLGNFVAWALIVWGVVSLIASCGAME